MRKRGSCLEKDNTRNNARKTTHSLDGQHQYVDRTPHGRVNQNDRGERREEGRIGRGGRRNGKGGRRREGKEGR